jgi:hypothetical protein
MEINGETPAIINLEEKRSARENTKASFPMEQEAIT